MSKYANSTCPVEGEILLPNVPSSFAGNEVADIFFEYSFSTETNCAFVMGDTPTTRKHKQEITPRGNGIFFMLFPFNLDG